MSELSTKAEMTTKLISWSDESAVFHRFNIALNTGVAAVDKAGAKIVELHAAYKVAQRDHEAARDAVERLRDDARSAAVAAGRIGQKADKKAIKKRKAAAIERAEDAELDWLSASASLRRAYLDYPDVLTHHAPALAARARTVAEAGILELTSALGIARRAQAKLSSGLGILYAVPTISSGELRLRTPKILKTPHDEFNESGAPTIHASNAADEMTKAIGYAHRIVEELSAAEKERAKTAKLEAEADAAPDLDDEDDDDDDL